MAQQKNQLDREKLCCSICLKDPATIPCGHRFCMKCANIYLDEDQKEIYSCPQCRQTFIPRPVLVRNTVRADLVEETKKMGLQAAPSGIVGPRDVACDFCTERKLKAIKSCLQCLVSYCEQHLQPHYDVPALKKHKLVDPFQKLRQIICSHHNEVKKVFCRTDQKCICSVCTMEEHKGHETVPAATEMTEKQKELKVNQQNTQRKIKEKEKDMKMLQQEISELKKRKAELEQLSHTKDPTQFLYNYTFLQDILSEEWTKTSLRGTEVDVLLPKTRAEFLKYKCQITLDKNTAHNYISIDSLKAICQGKRNSYHDHPDRFTDWSQVLCRQSLTARCYWEVEWKWNDVFIAVAYKDISRSGRESAFGNNDRSWALQCCSDGYEFRHNSIRTPVSGPQSSRIGVYLDHSAGILSFYSVSEATETMTLLHRVQTTFNRPVSPGFGLYSKLATAEIHSDSETKTWTPAASWEEPWDY